MLEPFALLFLLLPVAAASGWYVARRWRIPEEAAAPINVDYLRGLNYLVNDDADKAIEVFVRLLEVDNETAETHLALGNLFRRQGEVDRALRVHQNLVARPNLKPVHRNQARFELARDYLRAGVLDRAEALYRELVEQGMFTERALSGLVDIYEREQDWKQAIEIGRRLESTRGYSLRPVIAQYYCELAQQARLKGDKAAAREHLKQARSEYSECVRANLMLGAMEMQAEDYKAAIKAYQAVVKQDVDFLTEILEPLEKCYAASNNPEGWREFLNRVSQEYDGAAPHIAIARNLRQIGRDDAAAEHLADYLQDAPSWTGFYHLLDMARTNLSGRLGAPLESLREALEGIIKRSPRYQCSHCGFSGRTMHWQCPGCREWNSVAPLKDVQQISA